MYAIVNYEGFFLAREVDDAYAEIFRDVVARFYVGVTRYTTSSFMRAKLGDALKKRDLSPYIFETEQEGVARALPARVGAR